MSQAWCKVLKFHDDQCSCLCPQGSHLSNGGSEEGAQKFLRQREPAGNSQTEILIREEKPKRSANLEGRAMAERPWQGRGRHRSFMFRQVGLGESDRLSFD